MKNSFIVFKEGQRARREGESVFHDKKGEWVATFLVSGKLEFVLHKQYEIYVDFQRRKRMLHRLFDEQMALLEQEFKDKINLVNAELPKEVEIEQQPNPQQESAAAEVAQ